MTWQAPGPSSGQKNRRRTIAPRSVELSEKPAQLLLGYATEVQGAWSPGRGRSLQAELDRQVWRDLGLVAEPGSWTKGAVRPVAPC